MFSVMRPCSRSPLTRRLQLSLLRYKSTIAEAPLTSNLPIRRIKVDSKIRRVEKDFDDSNLPPIHDAPLRLCLFVDISTRDRLTSLKQRFCPDEPSDAALAVAHPKILLLSQLPGEHAHRIAGIVSESLKGRSLALPNAKPWQRVRIPGVGLVADVPEDLTMLCERIAEAVDALPGAHKVRKSRSLNHPLFDCEPTTAAKVVRSIENIFPNGISLGNVSKLGLLRPSSHFSADTNFMDIFPSGKIQKQFR